MFGRTVYEGVRPVTYGVFVYGVSSILISSLAGLYASGLVSSVVYGVGAAPPRVPLSAVADTVLGGGGLALAFLSLSLLVVGFVRMVRSASPLPYQERRKLTFPFLWWSVAFILLALAFVLISPWVISIYPPRLLIDPEGIQSFAVVAGASAALFLLALVSTVRALRENGSRVSAILVAALAAGLVGVAAQTLLLFGLRFGPAWLSFLGFPLLNFHFPFGALVGISAFLLWLSLRRIPHPQDTRSEPQMLTGADDSA